MSDRLISLAHTAIHAAESVTGPEFIGFDHPDLPPDVRDKILNEAKAHLAKWPQIKVKQFVAQPSERPNAHGLTTPLEGGGNRIDINFGVNGISPDLIEGLKRMESIGHFPVGASDLYRYMTIHELGHAARENTTLTEGFPQTPEAQNALGERIHKALSDNFLQGSRRYQKMLAEAGNDPLGRPYTELPWHKWPKLPARAYKRWYVNNLHGSAIKNEPFYGREFKTLAPDEVMADAWADVEINGENARPTSHLLHKLITDNWKPEVTSPIVAATKAIREAERLASTYYHITDNPDFRPDPNRSPQLNTTMGGDMKPGLFLTRSPEHWMQSYGYWRPYVAEIEAPDDIGEGSHLSPERYVLSDQYNRLHVKRVLPIDAYARENFGEYGWTESDSGKDFLTGEQLPKAPWGGFGGKLPGYRYPGTVADQSPQWRKQYEKQVRGYQKRTPGIIASRITAATKAIQAAEKIAGNIKLYHHTSEENALRLLQNGFDLSSPDGPVFLTTKKRWGKGRALMKDIVNPTTVELTVPSHILKRDWMQPTSETWYYTPASNMKGIKVRIANVEDLAHNAIQSARLAMADTSKWHPLIQGGADPHSTWSTYWIANDAGKKIAELQYSIADAKGIYIDSLFVHPQHQRQGIGQALMERLGRDYPYYRIDPGFTTPEGSGFTEHLRQIIPDAQDRIYHGYEPKILDDEDVEYFNKDNLEKIFARKRLSANTSGVRSRPTDSFMDRMMAGTLKGHKYPDEMDFPLYHGSRSGDFQPGDLIEPGHPGNFVRRMKHVYAADHPVKCHQYGNVYEVRPTGPVGHRADARQRDGYFASEWPYEVVRKVDPAEYAESLKTYTFGHPELFRP